MGSESESESEEDEEGFVDKNRFKDDEVLNDEEDDD
jgi:hypothetical protein